MDPAQEIWKKFLARQKPMNDVIDRGDSDIQQFYSGCTVFLTGGSGFIGKQLVEKLFRSCDIKKVYMLLRPKKGNTIQQRLASVLEDPVYDCLRTRKPKFAERIIPMEGEVENIRLGLIEKDWTTLTKEVNVIFHVAATVRFDEPITKATLINVRGTREALILARECENLKCFNYTSTAFTHTTVDRIEQDVEEKFYPCPIPPEVMIKMAETMDEERLNTITPSLIKGWPNTYTFTKALAEEVIRTSAMDLPVCIVKPPVVMSAHIEPSPGWIDYNSTFSSPIGGLLGIGLGVIHLLLVNQNITLCIAPVDYVNNAIMAASWDSAERRKKGETECPIYTVSSSEVGTKWSYISDLMHTDEFRRLSSPKTLWRSWVIQTSNDYVYWLLTWLVHYIPGYFVDGLIDLLRVRPKGVPSLVKVYTRIYKISKIYQYFSFNFWHLRDDNLQGMIQRMSPADRAIYNCDVKTIDIKEQMKVWCMGLRKFIVKDGLQGSAQAYKRQQYLFRFANIAFFAAYGYLIYYLLYLVYGFFSAVVQFFVLNKII